MVELVPKAGEHANETVKAFVSVRWCPKCGTAYHDVEDDNGGANFGWHHPASAPAAPRGGG